MSDQFNLSSSLGYVNVKCKLLIGKQKTRENGLQDEKNEELPYYERVENNQSQKKSDTIEPNDKFKDLSFLRSTQQIFSLII